MNIYLAYDKISKRFYTTFIREEDSAAVRDNLPLLCRVKPIQDIAIYNVGSLDTITGKIDLLENPYIVDISDSTYKFDEIVMSDMKKTEAQRQIEFVKLQQELEIQNKRLEIERAKAELEQYAKNR